MDDVIGILHPGAMGAGVAGLLAKSGHEVLWVGAGRSEASRSRAEAAGLVEVQTLDDLTHRATLIFSICPPEFAVDVAEQVIASGYQGLYCDANSIAPSNAEHVAGLIESGGAKYVDGGIIGAPPLTGGTTGLYFSGEQAKQVAGLFSEDDHIRSYALDGTRTAASSVKICYAAWSKGQQGLILAVRAAAMANGIEDALLAEFALTQPDAIKKSEFARQSIFKGWRYAGEMREIAKCFSESGVTPGFHLAAEQIFNACAELKDIEPAPDIETILNLIVSGS